MNTNKFDHIDIEAYVVGGRDGVKLVDDYDLVYGQDEGPSPLYGDHAPYSDEGIAIFKEFCKEKGISYYAAPKEKFFLSAGYERAIYEGNTYLIAEDLS